MKLKLLLYVLLIMVITNTAWPACITVAAVDLLYFFATPGTTSIMLSWETATEFNNAGFYVLRSQNVAGTFESISPRIVSIGDPFTGYYYQYEDTSVQIGVQYYYVLQILNSDGTSDYTPPVAAIIPAPTATPTMTPTRTQTPIVSHTPTATFTPTGLASATLTTTSVLPTNTVTPTLTPSATKTPTPTTTLGPISISGVNFPVLSPSPSSTRMVGGVDETSPAVDEEGNGIGVTSPARVLSIVVVVIILWVVLAVFLYLVVRHFNRNEKQIQ